MIQLIYENRGADKEICLNLARLTELFEVGQLTNKFKLQGKRTFVDNVRPFDLVFFWETQVEIIGQSIKVLGSESALFSLLDPDLTQKVRINVA